MTEPTQHRRFARSLCRRRLTTDHQHFPGIADAANPEDARTPERRITLNEALANDRKEQHDVEIVDVWYGATVLGSSLRLR
jgi:hypothetical protein